MNNNDLFSFLDETEQDVHDDTAMETDAAFAPESTKKRKAGSSSRSKSPMLQNGDAAQPEQDHEPGSSVPKKPRLASPKPVVVDEFETEAKREVAASAGLTGGVEAGSRLELRHQVRHQVAVPPGYNYVPIANHVPPTKPVREYKFTLDPFQQVSVHAIQRNESVLVSAHTSAGKTVVAEYAIAQCLQNKQRVIYTSPIKALSNQKYREMLAEFGDVGLMTGDVTINPSATCLVMTTEILRSMLYRGSEIMREVAWVIFDEIHYMRDKERGVVWEETIILLPHTVRYVFLSATIPNAMQFAEWICKSHEQPCHVVYTDFRPTPLQHYLFPAGGEGIYLVVNEKGEFREDNFTKAMGMLMDKTGEDPADSRGGKGRKGKTRKGGDKKGPSDISKIIKMIMLKNYNPVIVFAFSKRECEALALTMSKFEFNGTDEQDLVTNIFNNAIENLSADDRQLPQISNLLPLLKRGVGIHHGGLLPILKEVIEILFQEGLIKVLFATETFSIGLNMPAKTVVFTAARKFDGREFRNLSSGEYIQMSGRAGRRGLDDRGVVIMMCDEKLEPSGAKDMIKGEADRLDSAFHLGYNMVLNLMKVEGISPEYMLERCFFQFQNSAGVPVLEEELKREEEAKDSIIVADEAQVSEYYTYRQQLDQMGADFRDVITHPNYSLPFLQPGRLVNVKYMKMDFGWGVVINYQKRLPPKNRPMPVAEDIPPHEQYIVDVLLNCASDSVLSKDRNTVAPTPGGVQPCASGEKGAPLVVPVLLSTIHGISHIRIFLPKDLRHDQGRETAWKSVLEVQRRFPDGIALLDPIQNMDIKDDKFKELVRKIEVMEDKMFSSPIHKDPRLPELYSLFGRKQESQAKIRALKKRIQATHDVLQMEELKCRKRVLRRLGFTTSADIVDMKGRVACEISTGDELLLTELIFNGVFNPLSPEQSAGLLSCFVFTEKSEQATKLKEELAAPLRTMQEIARRIAKVSKESKLPAVEDEYVSSFKVELMDAVVQWCRGASFSDICKLTDQFEGSLIRVFRRLGELIRQMTQAAKVIGNTELQEKFTKASEMLERPNSTPHDLKIFEYHFKVLPLLNHAPGQIIRLARIFEHQFKYTGLLPQTPLIPCGGPWVVCLSLPSSEESLIYDDGPPYSTCYKVPKVERAGPFAGASAMGRLHDFHEHIQLRPDPSSLSDIGFSNSDLDPVPEECRTWAWFNIIGFWFSQGFAITGLEAASSMVALGMNPGMAILAAAIGNLLVMVPCAFNGYTGALTGLNFPVINRAVFGVRGAKIAVIMRALVAMFLFGVQSYIGGQSIYQMLVAIWPSIAGMKNTLPASSHTTSVDLLCFFIFWFLTLPFLYISVSRLRWLLLVKCMVMPVAGIALFIWAVVEAKGFGPLLVRPTNMTDGYSFSTVFLTGITSTIGPSATFALNMADFCRYSKRPRDAFWGTFWFMPICHIGIAFLGVSLTSASEQIYGVVQWNPVLVVGLFENRAAKFFTAFIFAFATLGTNICANSISFGNDAAFLVPRYINIRRGSFICGLLGFAITPWNIENSAVSFMAFLNGYTVFLGPIAGLMMVDFYIVRKRRFYHHEYYKIGGIYWYWKGVNWRGIAAFVLAIVPNMPGLVNAITPRYVAPQGAKNLYTMSWLVGFVVAGFLHWVFHTIFPTPIDPPAGNEVEDITVVVPDIVATELEKAKKKNFGDGDEGTVREV